MKSGFVAIVGRPNVGKSTLLNLILGEKVSIVSPKPQTTRTRLLGILNREDAQLVLIDTPGIHRPRGRLNEYMVRTALAAVSDVDIVLVLAEAGPPHPDDRLVLEATRSSPRPKFLAVNKIDRYRRKTDLIPILDELSRLGEFEAVVPISALTGENVERLVELLIERLPEGPRYFPADMVTDQTERALASELIREQIYFHTEQELPYVTAVQIDSWEEVYDTGPDAEAGAGARVGPEGKEEAEEEAAEEAAKGAAEEAAETEGGEAAEAGGEAAEARAEPEAAAGRGGAAPPAERPAGAATGRRRLVRISATIHVERESQKGIVIGRGGRRLKAIGTAARAGLERLLGCQVFLELYVRVQRNWTRDQRRLREFGYE